MNMPLSHIKVLDLSRVLAGPWATQMLGDLGADILKIERPHMGDDTRRYGPPFLENADGTQGDAAYYLCANRNKTNIQVDLSSVEGQAKIRELVKAYDVVVENYKVGGLKKYGLDYESLSEINPQIIYCSITGFGQTGPYAQRSGYDFMIQAMGGLMSITGEPGAIPQKVGVAVADLMTGQYASTAILAALIYRDKTGEGQHIDLALFDCQLAMLANQNMNYLVGGQTPERMGNAHPNIVPYQVYPTQDGHIALAIANDGQFTRYCDLIAEDWATDSRFCTNAARVENRDILNNWVAEVMAIHSTQYWIEKFEQCTIPSGPINSIADVFKDPQIIHRDMLREVCRSDGTRIPTVANPIKFSKTPIQYTKAPPALG